MATIPAVVAHAPSEPGKMDWRYEQIQPPRQPQEHEVLVRVRFSGICHTDLFVGSMPEGTMGITYPKLLGHEGAGEVEAVGPGVTVAKPGDRVILSHTFCGDCDLCLHDQRTYCENFMLVNSLAAPGLYETAGGSPVAGKFFGQSSFAHLALVDEKSVVNVTTLITTPEELKRCAPLGCGLMTGSGAVWKNCQPHDIALVTGIGAVGAGAIMTAKIIGCKAIIAVDRVESRLQVAKELGATHVYDTRQGEDFVQAVRDLVQGQRISYAFDTTGATGVMEKALAALGKRGRLLSIGVPGLTTSVTLPMADFYFENKALEVNFLGDAKAQEMVPRMIQWYKEGKFPLDQIIKFYPVKDFQLALEEMKTSVIKPVIKF